MACLIHAWRSNTSWLTACSSVCSPYTPRMAYIRSTLRKIFDFHTKDLLCSWQDATLDHLQRQFLEHTTAESFMRATLHKMLDFQVHNMIHSWHQAMLNATCVSLPQIANSLCDFEYEAWFSHYGVPECVSSDTHGAFSTKAVRLCRITGYPIRSMISLWHQAMLDASYGNFEYEAWFSHWTRCGLSTYLDSYIQVALILGFRMLNCVTA